MNSNNGLLVVPNCTVLTDWLAGNVRLCAASFAFGLLPDEKEDDNLMALHAAAAAVQSRRSMSQVKSAATA